MFSGAEHIIGVLGAECTNMVFSPNGVRFLGLAPEHMQDDFFFDLCSLKNGTYFCLHGSSDDPTLGMNSSFSVDMGELQKMLDDFEAC